MRNEIVLLGLSCAAWVGCSNAPDRIAAGAAAQRAGVASYELVDDADGWTANLFDAAGKRAGELSARITDGKRIVRIQSTHGEYVHEDELILPSIVLPVTVRMMELEAYVAEEPILERLESLGVSLQAEPGVPSGETAYHDTCNYPIAGGCYLDYPGDCHESDLGGGWVYEDIRSIYCNPQIGCNGMPGCYQLGRQCHAGGSGQITPCGVPTGGAGCGICWSVKFGCNCPDCDTTYIECF